MFPRMRPLARRRSQDRLRACFRCSRAGGGRQGRREGRGSRPDTAAQPSKSETKSKDDPSLLRGFGPFGYDVVSVAFSPDGKRIYTLVSRGYFSCRRRDVFRQARRPSGSTLFAIQGQARRPPRHSWDRAAKAAAR